MRLTFGCSLLPTTVFARNQATTFFSGLKIDADTVQFGDKSKSYPKKEAKKPALVRTVAKQAAPLPTDTAIQELIAETDGKAHNHTEDPDAWKNEGIYKDK